MLLHESHRPALNATGTSAPISSVRYVVGLFIVTAVANDCEDGSTLVDRRTKDTHPKVKLRVYCSKQVEMPEGVAVR
jgi:hypothetical protein